MGHSTRFEGQFNLDRPLTVEQYSELEDFSKQDHRNDVGMPGIWCDWIPTRDGMGIEHNGSEKFYNYVEWMKYLIEHFLKPWGYKVSGTVSWQGDNPADRGMIIANDNEITRTGAIRNEATITVELSAFETLHLINAVSARLDQLAASEPTNEAVREVQALHSIIMKIEPQARNMAKQERTRDA